MKINPRNFTRSWAIEVKKKGEKDTNECLVVGLEHCSIFPEALGWYISWSSNQLRLILILTDTLHTEEESAFLIVTSER